MLAASRFWIHPSPPSEVDRVLPSLLQAYGRITRDVRELHSSESKQHFKNLRAISAAVVENGGVVSAHPLGF